jgi:hypothetical protein
VAATTTTVRVRWQHDSTTTLQQSSKEEVFGLSVFGVRQRAISRQLSAVSNKTKLLTYGSALNTRLSANLASDFADGR